MSAKLVAEERFLRELVLAFDEGDQWVIGRDPDACQLLVEDPAASRKHAVCRRTSQGILLENLSSTNPVLINQQAVARPQLLQQGDMVKIGDSVFRFYAEPEPAAHVIDERVNGIDPPEEESSLFEEEGKEGAQINFDLLSTGRWLLKVLGGPNSGAEFSMQSGHSYLIGTDPNSCDIVFYDTSVSRQQARITVEANDTLTIEDLKSRNGTRINGEPVDGKRPLPPNTVVGIGTSSFVVYDREGEMQTIISPLLPSIVKVLQKEESRPGEQGTPTGEGAASSLAPAPVVQEKPSHALGAFILTAILIGLFAIAGIGIKTLFTQQEVVVAEPQDPNQILQKDLAPFPGVKYTFNQATGKLLLVGHVLTAADKNEMMYNLAGLKFINEVDDSGVIIDEYVWTEANQILTKNPNWRGVTIHGSTPGHFIVSGYLQTRHEAELVWDYLSRNFPYIDLLENKIVVEEDVVSAVQTTLHDKGFNTIKVQMNGGDLNLSGTLSRGKKEAYDALVESFKKITGIRNVKNYVTEVAPQEAVINISDRYTVSGVSQLGNGSLSVVINGRILGQGDVLDGMKITKVQSNAVYLEKDGNSYKIDIVQQ